MWKNPQIDKSSPIAPFYDSLYWSFGSALDPGGCWMLTAARVFEHAGIKPYWRLMDAARHHAGGPGKAPFTAGGRIFMCGHWFYLTIMVATYTGVLGPFLMSSSELQVTGFESLREGQHTIAVRGPKWDDKVPEPEYRGYYRGGNGVAADPKKGTPATPRSTQFKILQSEMSLVSIRFWPCCKNAKDIVARCQSVPVDLWNDGRTRKSNSTFIRPVRWTRSNLLMGCPKNWSCLPR